ncbi:hypothetical protein BC826DRAFT_100257 [Russula brevipes]|nr:hypothetical protein BC826DRAFT_100257 [Russula brevipes]
MDALLDVASTSDADERELLEAANSDLYWDRVTAKRYPHVKLDFHPPNAMSGQGDDTQLRTSRVYRRSTPVEDTHSSSISHPGPHTSSSPPPHGSPCPTIPENLTTTGYTDIEQPTSPPASSFLVASTSVSSLPHRPPGRLRHGATGGYSIGSPDPLQLFSSPTGHRVDPGGHHSSPTYRDAALHLASSPVTLGRGQIAGPGEFSSPSEHLRDRSPHPINLRQRAPSPDPFVAPPTDDLHHDGTLAPENAANAAGGRYSMRTRQPRQLKPYAFDRLAYNHQLKYHPDAIVKFRGHHSPVGSSSPASSHSSESDIDAAVGNSGGERLSGATQTLARAKGKKRPRVNREHPPDLSPTAHRRTSEVQPAGGSPSLGRRFPGSPAVANPARATPISDLGSDNRPEEAITWYPDAYDDLSSGLGSDELPLTAQNDLHVDNELPSRVKRRRVTFSLLLYGAWLWTN